MVKRKLTSPPFAYSITKHSRSCVWNAYFSVCGGESRNRVIVKLLYWWKWTVRFGNKLSQQYSHWWLTVKKGCRVFWRTLLSVTVCATSSCSRTDMDKCIMYKQSELDYIRTRARFPNQKLVFYFEVLRLTLAMMTSLRRIFMA